MRRVKLRFWLFVCWWVRAFGIRGDAWYQEHKSRVRHSLGYLDGMDFDYAAYGRAILEQSKSPDRKDFVPLS